MPNTYFARSGWATFALCLALSPVSSAFGAFGVGKHASLPDQPVIETLTPQSASGASNKALSTASLAQVGVVVGDFGSTASELDRLLKRVRAQSPAPGLPVWVKIDSSPVANAHTLAGGNIILNAGLIKALETRDERRDALAFILAHEYAHAFFDDPASQIGKENEVNQMGQAVSLAASLMNASRTSAGLSAANNCARATGTNPVHVLAGAVMTGEWVKAELYRFSYGPFSREMETRADFFATDLLVRAGLNPVAGSKPIEDLYEKYDASIQKRLQNQLKSVQGTIEQSLGQLGACAPDMLQHSINGASLKDQMQGFMKNQLIGWTSKFVQSRFNKEQVHIYYSADARVRAIRNYTEKFYPGQIVDATTDLSAFGGSDPFGKFAAEDDIYQLTDEILQLNAQGNYAQALDSVSKAEKKHSARPLEFLVAAGTAAKGAGKTTRAIGYYEAASKKPEAIGVVYRSLADLYAEEKQTDKALGALDRGETKLKDRKQFIVPRISIYHASGNAKRVATLVEECQGLGDASLARECRHAGATEEETAGPGILDQTQKAAGNALDKTGKTAGNVLDQTGKAAGGVFNALRDAVPGSK